MKKHLYTIPALLAMLFPSLSFADDEGLYFGIGGGLFRADVCGDIPGCREDDAGYGGQVAVGYQFNRHIGIEGGVAGSRGFGASIGTANADADVRSLYGAGVGRFPLTESFSLLGKVGFHRYETEAEARVSGSRIRLDDDGSRLLIGFGAEFELSDRIAVRPEVVRWASDLTSAQISILIYPTTQ